MALVVTLILLSVITFLAVTFLVVSRRGAEQVATLTDQTKAKQAADEGAQKAIAVISARMLASGNGFGFPLMVSTNWGGAVYNQNSNQAVITNTGYVYANGNALSQRDQLQMLNNLLVLPRAPVFVQNPTNRLLQEFRYYLDLNRNGRFETNGLTYAVTNNGAPMLDTNGSLIALTNVVGDPEWIGVLDHPDQRHSSSNYFVGRYAYFVLPAGEALDLNFIHNQAKLLGTNVDGFRRNEGYGSWEINLAGLLHALNPRHAFPVDSGWDYNYETNTFSSTGFAFQDANSLLQYRYNGDYRNLGLFSALYVNFPSAVPNFGSDGIDGYLGTTLMTSLSNLPPDNDGLRVSRFPWCGGNNANQFYFSSRDLFTPSTLMGGFPARLFSVSTNRNTFDSYTFYRMLAQLGTDSERETGKMNLNYNNIGYVTNSGFVATTSTNFVPWTPVQFFTNAANRLLQSQPEYAALGITSITNIQVYPFNGYTPAVHRLLQLAANMYDATQYKGTTNGGFDYPSVFRPVFGVTNINGTNNIYIRDYVEVGTNADYLVPPLSLPEDVSLVTTNTTNIYGVPWIIGARKGFPNFNEIAIQSISQLTRKMKIDKTAIGAQRSKWRVNVQYVLGVSNTVGVEAWNSYASNYTRPIDIIVGQSMTMYLTNENGVLLSMTTNFGRPLTTIANWPGFSPFRTNSFITPVLTNVPFLTNIVYQNNGLTKVTIFPDPSLATSYPLPQFGLNITNRLRFIMVDHATGRVIDYVQLNGMDQHRRLMDELSLSGADNGPGSVWNTNRVPSGSTSVTDPVVGMTNQIDVSMHGPPWAESGGAPVTSADWTSASLPGTGFQTVPAAAKGFNAFMNGTDTTNVSMQVPYSPTRTVSTYFSWQANDPLVHYTLSDLTPSTDPNSPLAVADVGTTNFLDNNTTVTNFLPNIGRINNRYLPWNGQGNPNPPNDDGKFLANMGIKDPQVNRSDDWQFPTNKFPSIGWLGRVHRGTPWQTVYMKASATPQGFDNDKDWQAWTGNSFFNGVDAVITRPTNDWSIFDQFTVAPNDSATRGQLSVNQTNLAAWAAVLDGVIVNSNDPALTYPPIVITPSADPNNNPNDPIWKIVNGINTNRANIRTKIQGNMFTRVGEILATPELTTKSPYLDPNAPANDAAYERLPQQILSLLKVGKPRFVIYAYGQALKPANNSIFSGSVNPALNQFKGTCTNYQVTAEVLTRTVVRLESYDPNKDFPADNAFTALNPTHNPVMLDISQGNPPGPRLRAVIESFAILPAD